MQASRYLLFDRGVVVGLQNAAFGVVAIDALNRTADIQQALRVVEHALIRLVPGHQAQLAIHHRDALNHALNSGLQQLPIEGVEAVGAADHAGKVCVAQLLAVLQLHEGLVCRGAADHAGDNCFRLIHGKLGGAIPRQYPLLVAVLEFLPKTVQLVGFQEGYEQSLQLAAANQAEAEIDAARVRVIRGAAQKQLRLARINSGLR